MQAISSFNSFTAAATSAYEVLQICDRQAKRDCTKLTRASYQVYLLLSSRQAKQTYRSIATLFVIAGMIAIALGMSARDVWEKFCNWAEAEVQQFVSPIEPVVVAEPIAVCEEAIEPTPIEEMSAIELRKECQKRGIVWRNVYGKNKHLPKSVMISLLV